IKDTKKGEEFYFFSADIEPKNKDIQDFYKRYDPKRKAKGLIVKGIAPLRLKHLFQDRIKRKVIQTKFTNQIIPPNMGIFQDKIFLIVWGEKPAGYLIYSKQLAERYKQFFNSIWNSIK
ncbi:hypothetical protein KY343_03915, partial [Candidatus Woesearchaeota archaeon]|nr:hypothetical protein [Candidatus Woesearchaeota archaeon]